jgi:hypothetical protein
MIRAVVLSGSGWLFPWHVGVVSALAKEGLLKKIIISYRKDITGNSTATANTRFYGTSGGSVVASGFVFGLSGEEIMELGIEVARLTRQHGLLGNLDRLIKEIVKKKVASRQVGVNPRNFKDLFICVTSLTSKNNKPEEPSSWFGNLACYNRKPLFIYNNLSKSIFFRISQLFKRPDLLNDFKSEEDVLDACICSSFIPYYTGKKLYKEYKGSMYVDGGLFYSIIPPFEEKEIEFLKTSNSNFSLFQVESFNESHVALPNNFTCPSKDIIISCPLPLLARKAAKRAQLCKELDIHIITPPRCFSLFQLLRYTLVPGPETFLRNLEIAGKNAARLWMLNKENSSNSYL